MKRVLFMLLAICLTQGISAQSDKRKAEQVAAKNNNANTLTIRAQLSFPTEMKMNEDVVWRRDVYRELNLNDDANASLYYPVEPLGAQMNLFTYIFKLMMTGNIRAYEYRLDGNEVFNEASRIKPMAFLDNYHIFYERTNQGVHIDDSDIPSREVTAYYIKECSYYDQVTATFHTKVLALCPILRREEDLGNGVTSYPLFWVKYDDLAPFLAKQTIMTSNLNNAAVMSIDDYFTENMYRGKIYKTTNMLGKTLSQYCLNDSAMTKEQKRIEGEIKAFEENIWGDKTVKDSLDSVAKLQRNGKKVIKMSRRSAPASTRHINYKSDSKSSSTSSAARVTVRRQRH